MTEDEARDWTKHRFDPITVQRLQKLAEMVVTANQRHNLISSMTVDAIWSRHIVDSLQILRFGQPGAWLDIGTGAGFPGLAIAAAEPHREVLLVEPRRLRADHLHRCAATLRLDNVKIISARVNVVRHRADVISARAVARTAALFASAYSCSAPATVWLLPKGRRAKAELAEAKQSWHGVFHVEQSITEAASSIIVARQVRPR